MFFYMQIFIQKGPGPVNYVINLTTQISLIGWLN